MAMPKLRYDAREGERIENSWTVGRGRCRGSAGCGFLSKIEVTHGWNATKRDRVEREQSSCRPRDTHTLLRTQTHTHTYIHIFLNETSIT